MVYNIKILINFGSKYFLIKTYKVITDRIEENTKIPSLVDYYIISNRIEH